MIPPLVGFFGKYMVLYSAIENGYFFLSIVAILTSVIAASYYLKIIRVLYFESSAESVSKCEDTTALTNTHSFIIATLTMFILLFVIKPSLLLNSTQLLALTLFYT